MNNISNIAIGKPIPFTKILTLILAVILVGSIVHSMGRRIYHDQAMYVYCGKQILDGKLPYIDFVELNFPAIMFLSVVPEMIKQGTGWSYDTSFSVFVFLYMLVCLGLLFRVSPERDAIFLSIIFCLSGFILLVDYEFGQREHLFFLSWIPYLALRTQRLIGTPSGKLHAIITGIIAGIGISLKPHFVLFWILTEIFLLISYKRFRILFCAEILCLIFVNLLYAGHFLVLGTFYLESFFNFSIQEGLSSYSMFDFSKARIFGDISRNTSIFFPLCIFVVFFMKQKDWVALYCKLLLLTSLVTLALYISQSKGTIHHLVPYWGSIIICSFFLVWDIAIRQGNTTQDFGFVVFHRRYDKVKTFRISFTILLFTVFFSYRGIWPLKETVKQMLSKPTYNPLVTFLEQNTTSQDKVVILTTNLLGPFPAILLTQRELGIEVTQN